MIRSVSAKISDPFIVKDLLPCFFEGDREEAARNIALNPALSFSIITDSEVLGCVGATEWLPGVFGIWALLDKNIVKHGLAYHKLMKKMIRQGMGNDIVRRIQVLVKSGNEAGIRQNEGFGLKKEGLLRGAGPGGENMIILAAVKGDF